MLFTGADSLWAGRYDAGAGALIAYKVDPASGQTVQTVAASGAANTSDNQ